MSSFEKLVGLCKHYGLWAEREGVISPLVFIWSCKPNQPLLGSVWIKDDWEKIEGYVVELAMSDAFKS